MTRIRTALVYAALVLMISSRPAGAQLSTAQLDGRVTDESGAVLPGVTVTVTQTKTGFTRVGVTEPTDRT